MNKRTTYEVEVTSVKRVTLTIPDDKADEILSDFSDMIFTTDMNGMVKNFAKQKAEYPDFRPEGSHISMDFDVEEAEVEAEIIGEIKW